MSADKNPADLEFAPAVPEHMSRDVEQRLFFNARQSLLIDRIHFVVGQYGAPEIVSGNGHIRSGVPENDMQLEAGINVLG